MHLLSIFDNRAARHYGRVPLAMLLRQNAAIDGLRMLRAASLFPSITLGYALGDSFITFVSIAAKAPFDGPCFKKVLTSR